MLNTRPEVTEAIQNAFLAIRRWRENERDARLMEVDSLAGIRERVRQEIEDARPTEAVTAGAGATATFEEIYSNLSVASSRLQQFGASDAQVRFLASLAVKQGLLLSQIEMNTLSKAEASAMIDHMKREG